MNLRPRDVLESADAIPFNGLAIKDVLVQLVRARYWEAPLVHLQRESPPLIPARHGLKLLSHCSAREGAILRLIFNHRNDGLLIVEGAE